VSGQIIDRPIACVWVRQRHEMAMLSVGQGIIYPMYYIQQKKHMQTECSCPNLNHFTSSIVDPA
jgi:hypothetical protein